MDGIERKEIVLLQNFLCKYSTSSFCTIYAVNVQDVSALGVIDLPGYVIEDCFTVRKPK